jgi:hypothetical protein
VSTLDGFGEGVAAEDDITFVMCQFDPSSDRNSGRASVRQGAA